MLADRTGLTEPEVLDLVAGGDAEAVGPFADRPALVVRLDGATGALPAATAALPCVVIGLGEPGDVTDGCDVLVTDAAEPPAPWVQGRAVDVLEAAEAAAAAAVALAQLLRLGPELDLHGALVAESLTYGLLQSGSTYRHWLATRRIRPHVDSPAPVLVDRDGPTLSITLNRPEVRNAFDVAMRDGLVEALRLVAADGSITEVEWRGAGENFCSGGDLSEFGTVPDPVTGHLVRMSRSAAVALAAVAERVTVHLHGACVGAGIELPALARRVVAAPGTTFRLPEVTFGLVPGAGGTATLPRRIGWPRTAWLGLTGAVLDVETALRWGLVDAIE
ncbi:MAG TPA: enoyl-CoA hydratase/isomerase family protein [Acidimicrobiales bacterium]|nr:enoyl-CoA hydratase/isomerase family protein [Acidimicrobiales bacterium]